MYTTVILAPGACGRGSEPQLHPPFSDENPGARSTSSWRSILEQPSHTLGSFFKRMKLQKLDFSNTSHSFAFLESQDFWTKGAKMDLLQSLTEKVESHGQNISF